jgi:hypothetical protein
MMKHNNRKEKKKKYINKLQEMKREQQEISVGLYTAQSGWRAFLQGVSIVALLVPPNNTNNGR